MLMANVNTTKFSNPPDKTEVDAMVAEYNKAMLTAIQGAKRPIVIWRDILNGTFYDWDGVHFHPEFRMKRCAEVSMIIFCI